MRTLILVVQTSRLHMFLPCRRDACTTGPLAAVLVFLLTPTLGYAFTRTDDEVLTEAQAAFRQGVAEKTRLLQARKDFAQAADAYLELHERGIRNAALYRNLGDAALLADRWPEAIRAYHLGLSLDPNDRAMREHLAFARGKVVLPSGNPVRFDADAWPLWLHRPTVAELSIVFASAYTLAWLLGTCAVATRSFKLTLLTIAAVLIVAASGFFWGFKKELAEIDRQTPLIVIAENTPFYKGNGPSYPQHTGVPLLPRGLEARQIHRRGDWLQIRLSTGETGWMPSSQALIVSP